jgi:hypothetical protein
MNISNSIEMTKRTLVLQIVAVTIVALIAAAWWAVVDVLFVFIAVMYSSTIQTDSDIIRYFWHVRLVQPEWLNGGNNLFKWQQAEVIARLVTVFLVWFAAIVAFLIRYRRGQGRDNQPVQPQPLIGPENCT